MAAASMCVFFMRGTCRFGNRCWNSHDLSTRNVSPYIDISSDESEESEDSLAEFYARGSSPDVPHGGISSPRAQPQAVSEPVPKSEKDQSGSSQPLWNLTNSSSGETREGTPDTILVETVKKLNEAENLVKTLRQQLRLKDESENFSWVEHQMEQCAENDLQCNICYELFVKPTVLNCSHTFCHDCIDTWSRRVNHCPTCRVYIKNKAYCLTLDSFLDKIVECLPEELKTRREHLKVERSNARVETNRSRRNQPSRRRNRNQSMHRTLGMLWGERDRDGAEWNISVEEALIDPIRLGDVLGRNRNDRDEWADDLSDSSLDSNNDVYGYRLCSYCDNMGHSASNCPLFLVEDDYGQLW